MEEWEALVAKTETRPDIREWAYPLSEGLYMPTPLVSLAMCMACETDSIVERFPGTAYALFPEDSWAYVVHGSDEYIVGWIQYLQYRFPNVVGWSSYTETLGGRPYIDVSRIVRLLDTDAPSRLDQIRRSNPTGVRTVIQTDTEDPIHTFALSCLTKGGDLFYITVLPVEEEIIKPVLGCFEEIKVIRPAWSTSVSLPLVVLCCLNYNGNAAHTKSKQSSKVLKQFKESIQDVLTMMIAQQKYLESFLSDPTPTETAPTFIQFLTDGFASWNI
jgi:hypothetical protein